MKFVKSILGLIIFLFVSFLIVWAVMSSAVMRPLASFASDVEVRGSDSVAIADVRYHVWRIFPGSGSDNLAKAIVSVDSKDFCSEAMKDLANKLMAEFENESRIEASLSDDAITAKLFSQGKIDYPTYENTERGRYYLDRIKCKQYIEFSSKKGASRKRIDIECSTK